ncbi:putative leucine-rich repeat-containing protein DDB_G0290503 isoform X2 [Euwallacea similis]|uniref:putative leucine-rich repeat-containing protein DDB_G0290503 isoform X2 n=1 Tax=Euwallacea similis TaxID=1736056 RepID=UPI00344D89DB
MSDTDDTDDLLLIPPDFFLVHSEPEPPYYTIVDSLIKQVSDLRDRIEGIEYMSDVSLNSLINPTTKQQSLDLEKSNKMFDLKPISRRKYYSNDDLYQPWSTQSTPQKPHEKIQLNSLPNSPSTHIAKKSMVKFNTPQKSLPSLLSKRSPTEETEVLNEIDTFISNVKSIQRNHAVRNLESAFSNLENKQISSKPNKDIGNTGKLLHGEKDVKESVSEPNKQLEKMYKEKLENNAVPSERFSKVNAWQCGDNIESVPDYGAGIRDLLYKQKKVKDIPIRQSHVQPIFQASSSTTTNINSTITSFNESSPGSSESTQLTAYNRLNKQGGINKFSQELFQRKVVQPENDERQNLESTDFAKVCEERNELLQSPLHDNALAALNMHKQLLENSNLISNDEKLQKKRNINTLSDNLALLNLADIWGTGQVPATTLAQKVQEEKLRRQHCEHLIQELQSKNLELQQKLAVAIQVDQTKNQSIEQLGATLEITSLKLKKLNEEKTLWEIEVGRMQNQFSVEIESANQKIAYYETEATKCLSVTQENKEKMSLLEKRCMDLQSELQQNEMKFKELQASYQKEYEKNKKLADIISLKEIELNENKNVLNNAREEVAQSRKAIEVCQSEFTLLKDECSLLQSELRDNKNTILNLTEQKKKLTNELTIYKSNEQIYKTNEKTLKEALEQSKHKLENTKVELRNFYQGQLELIVENKRKEMQNQLDQENQNNLEEIKRKELSMAKTAANHIKEISEKCALETRLLEQKHQEEIRLYQVQMSQKDKELEYLQSKLAHLPEKRAEIAKKLQKVMEDQWNEALKMISGSSSPLSNEQSAPTTITLPSKQFPILASTNEQLKKENTQNVAEYDETPVSSRVTKQGESEIQKYINMLLNRLPGNPIEETKDKPHYGQQRASWNVPVRSRKPK